MNRKIVGWQKLLYLAPMKVDTGGDFWQEKANKKCCWHAHKGHIIQLAIVQNVQAGQQLGTQTTGKSSK